MPRRLPRYCTEDTDRHGNVRIYFRRKGSPKIRMHGTPWTPDFMEQYRVALGGDAVLPRRKGTRALTWKWLCQKYFAWAPTHSGLKRSTFHVRRQILESTFDEPIRPGAPHTFGDMPLASMTSKAIKVLRDRKIATPAAANNRLKSIRRVFAYGLSEEIEGVATNPAIAVAFVPDRSDGHHTWTPDEVRRFMAAHPPGTTAYLAICLLLFVGVRRGDVVRLGRQHVRDGWIHYRQDKKGDRADSAVEVPLLPELEAAIAATDTTGDLTFLVTSFGKPFTANGFGNKMRAWCDEAGLPHCSAHGLRKAGATIAAERGGTERQLMAIYGWKSAAMAQHYTRKADRRRLAGGAMHLIGLDENRNTKCPTEETSGTKSEEKTAKSTA
jgi:integrase